MIQSLSFVRVAQKRWAIFFAFITLFLLGLADNIRGPLFPEALKAFEVDSTVGSLIFAVASGAAFLGSWLSQHYLKKYTIMGLLNVAVFVMFVGLLSMGLAGTYRIFLVASFVFGLSMGLIAVAQNLLITENVSQQNQSRALAGLHSMYGFSSFLAPLVAAQTATAFGFWGAAFLAIAALALIIFVAQVGIAPKKDVDTAIEGFATEDRLKTSTGAISFFTKIMFGGLFGFYVVAEIMVATRLAQYMRDYFLLDLVESSRYVTYFFLFLLVGRMFFAIKKISLPIKIQMNAALLLSILFLLLGLKLHPFFLTLVGLAMAPYYPLSVAYLAEKAGRYRRRILTFALAFQSLAVIAMHLGVGYLTDQFGLFYAFGVAVFALVLSLVCLNFHPVIAADQKNP